MKPLRAIALVLGVLLGLSGLTFFLQGLGIVGPRSSFMFSNQTWVYQGVAMFVLGTVVALAGLLLSGRSGAGATSG